MSYKTLADLIYQSKIEKNKIKQFFSITLSFLGLSSFLYLLYQFYHFSEILRSKPTTPENLIFQLYIYFFLSLSFLILISQIFFTIHFSMKNYKYKNLILKRENETILDKKNLFINIDSWIQIKSMISRNCSEFEKYIDAIKDFAIKINKIDEEISEIKKVKKYLFSIESNNIEDFLENNIVQKSFLEEINKKEKDYNDERDFLCIKFNNLVDIFCKNSKDFFKSATNNNLENNIIDLMEYFGQKFLDFEKLQKRKEFLICQIEQIKNFIHNEILRESNDVELINQFNSLPELIENYHISNTNYLLIDKYFDSIQFQKNKKINESEISYMRNYKLGLKERIDNSLRIILETEDKIKKNDFYKSKMEKIFPVNPSLNKENSKLILKNKKIKENIKEKYRQLLKLSEELEILIEIPEGDHFKACHDMMNAGDELFSIFDKNKKENIINLNLNDFFEIKKDINNNEPLIKA